MKIYHYLLGFMKKIRIKLLISILFILIFRIIYSEYFELNKPPLKKVLKFSESGVIADFDFKIDKHWIYYFSIRFNYHADDDFERNRILKIIGGYQLDKNGLPVEPGVMTPVNLRIFKKQNNSYVEIYKKNVIPVLTSWGGGRFAKDIGRCDLVPGEYRILIEKESKHKEYEDISTYFLIGMDKFKVSFDPENVDRSKTCPM